MTFLLPLLEMFAEFAGTVVSPFSSLLFCLQQINLANIEASATSFIASCSLSFNPSLCRLSPFLLPLCRCFKAISLQCRNLAKQRLKKVVKTSVINGELPKGGDTQNTTVCIDLMGLKVSK